MKSFEVTRKSSIAWGQYVVVKVLDDDETTVCFVSNQDGFFTWMNSQEFFESPEYFLEFPEIGKFFENPSTQTVEELFRKHSCSDRWSTRDFNYNQGVLWASEGWPEVDWYGPTNPVMQAQYCLTKEGYQFFIKEEGSRIERLLRELREVCFDFLSLI